MKHSEFWRVVDEVLGPAYGRSLARDLTLPGLEGRTAVAALEAGAAPDRVWTEICREMDLGEDARWHHRVDPRRRR